MTWELKGRFPEILESPHFGSEAKQLYHDANKMLDEIVNHRLLHAHGVIGLFPANTVGCDDIEIYTNDSRTAVRTVLHTLRQQSAKREGIHNMALADYIAPKESGRKDYIGCFVVTAGDGVDELVAKYEREHDDYNSILVKALADRLAEAMAEYIHHEARKTYWGYNPDENLTLEQVLREKYPGIRPAPGYPACPDHTEKKILFDLLSAGSNVGVSLTETYAMLPASSVCGFYFSHPQAKYFGLGKIGKDQVEDYARRRGMSVEEVERWLSPVLNYG